MFCATPWLKSNIDLAGETALAVDDADEWPIRPSCRAINCLRVTPDAPFVSLGGADTHVIRTVNDVSLIAKPGSISFEGHAVSSGGIFAFIVNRRVAVLNTSTHCFCLSDSDVMFDAFDIAVETSAQDGNVFVVAVGCEGVALWQMSSHPDALEGAAKVLDGPVHVSGSELNMCSKVAIKNSALALATLDGRVLIWDDIGDHFWNMGERQFATETVFKPPSERFPSDKITEITFSKTAQSFRLVVAWWSGCIELYQRGEKQWSLMWSMSNENQSTFNNQELLGHNSSGTFAVFAAHHNLLAFNTFNRCIRFLRSSDGVLVREITPEENSGEVKGLAATEKGVLVWYRSLLNLHLIEWPVLQLAKLSKQLQKPISPNSPLAAPSTSDKIVNCALESPESDVWRCKLYEVVDVILYHRKGSGELTIRDLFSRKTTPVVLPFDAKTLCVTADEIISEVGMTNEPLTLSALDVFASREVLACLFAKTILIYPASQKSWHAVICGHAVERGAVSFNIVAAVSARGELWRWNIESLSLVSLGTVVLPGPVFSIIGCACGSGAFAALGWRRAGKSNAIDRTFNGRYLAVLLPERGCNEDSAVEMSVPCVHGKLPECILALWSREQVLVLLFEISQDFLLAASYNGANLEYLDSKSIRREEQKVPLAYLMMRHNIPECYFPETTYRPRDTINLNDGY